MQITRLFDVLFYQAEKFPLDNSVNERFAEGWKNYSSSEIVEKVNALSSGLLKFGIQKNDRVAIASYNCPAWTIADYAISQIGGVNVPLYPNSSVDDYAHILSHSDAKIVFCGNSEIEERIRTAVEGMEYPPLIVTFIQDAKNTWTSLFEDFGAYETVILKRRNNVQPEELATIIYTSGTTGKPKGVMLSHRNILANCESLEESYPIFKWKERVVSFLPLCHIFERTAMYYYMKCGISIYLISDLDNLGEYIREVKPHYFNTVPRMLEKVYEKLLNAGNSLSGVKKKLFFWALELSKEYKPLEEMPFSYRLRHVIADKLIFSKWREALGGNINHILSGAAALQPNLVRIFWAAGIPVLEAYGLTETSPGVSISKPIKGDLVPGCVGRPLVGVEVKFSDEGELMVRGKNVMMGYYKNAEATAEVMDGEWFKTGDIGEFDNGGLIRITDRKKEIFKTSGGKYIAPQKIENLMKHSLLIEQIIVVGEGQKFPSALVVPREEYIGDEADLEVRLMEEVEKYNAELAQFEKIKKISVVRETWSVENGLLTPTMKMKRKAIHSRYEDLISNIYSE
ncbi:MAG: long-chain fatty acid--CoA ligase [Cyclobacteriaceae bacterium]